jgi:hypothetical protein
MREHLSCSLQMLSLAASETCEISCSDPSKPAKAMHRFESVGMVSMAVLFAVSPANDIPDQGYVTVKPYSTLECSVHQEESYLKSFKTKQQSETMGNWSIFDIIYELGPIPELACKLPLFAEVVFSVPPGYDIRIAAIRISGTGAPPEGQMVKIRDLKSLPPKEGLLSNMLFVWIAAGVGSGLILFLLVVLWFCCGKPSCCGFGNSVRLPYLAICRCCCCVSSCCAPY